MIGNKNRQLSSVMLSLVATLAMSFPGAAVGGEKENYSTYVSETFPMNVYWGDTHTHSSYSADAGMFGDRLGPDAAYKFARGEVVETSSGLKAKLIRPLDFLVVADHSENLGLAPMLEEANPKLLAMPLGRKLYDAVQSGNPAKAFGVMLRAVAGGKGDPLKNPELMASMWQRIIDAADRNYQPGIFTPLLGYEWSSMAMANNLHRVVVFRDDSMKVGKVIPFSSYDSTDPERLWDWMAEYEAKTGGRVLAIPHNGNTSNGQMFATETVSGQPLDANYAARRLRWEPLVEVTQMKGDSETHPLLSPDDEFADFETWDVGNMGFAAKTPDMLPYEYARSALRLGIQQEKSLGVNPFKFGMIGSTDTHTSLSTAREDNFFGKVPVVEPSASPKRFDQAIIYSQNPALKTDISVKHWRAAASGMAAVWARENNRESLFDAMQRKEVYATTGSRITVRFFGGWSYEEEDLQRPDFVGIGYRKGVPMGGDLPAKSAEAPVFMVATMKDPDGANLDRVQIVKGWVDEKGVSHEKVYDVALSDKRKVSWRGKVKPVGNTVDAKTATYTNSIGDPQLYAYWRDPSFNTSEHAFYYARVLEIPTPRWTTYDAARFGVDVPEGAELTIQDRAYTSPIWYQPETAQ